MSQQDPSIYLTAFTARPDECVQPQGEAGETVEEGECTASLAFAQGHFWGDIWERGENRELRQARTDAHVLMPGDRLFIPPIEPGERDRAIDQHHRFKRRGVPEKLRIRLLDGDEPRSNEPYLLRVTTPEGKKDQEGTTDADGKLEQWIHPEASEAILFLHDERFDIELGSLQPPDTMPGAIARLVNLGLLPDHASEDEVWIRAALGAFQKNHKLDVTYALNAATAKALEASYKQWAVPVPSGD